MYGISQNPDTKDYIIIFQDVHFSGNKKIDNLIQEMHLKISSYYSIVFGWIPYKQFNNVKEINKGDIATVYSAIWKDGPLHYDDNKKYIREPGKKVALKCIHNSQNITNEFLNEVWNFLFIYFLIKNNIIY